MKINAVEIKPGNILEYENGLWRVVKTAHTQPGKGGAYMQVEHVAELDTLQKWSMVTEIPCVAIGGITPDNAKPLIDAGADFLAVSSAVWNHPEGPAKAVEAFNALLA